MSHFPRNLYPQLDLLGNCIFGVNARKVAEAGSLSAAAGSLSAAAGSLSAAAGSLRAAAGSRCHFGPPHGAKVTH